MLPPADFTPLLQNLDRERLMAAVTALSDEFAAVFLVGGAVRDLMLGASVVDLDLVVVGDAHRFAEALAERLDGRVVGRHAFGTATVAYREADGGFQRLDIAMARREWYAHPAALPEVEPAGIVEDLARRDFTVNTLAIELDRFARGRLINRFDGLADLFDGRLVVLHEVSFIDDPTRILRAIRYEMRLGLRMSPATQRLAAAAVAAGLLGMLSVERLWGEIALLLNEVRIDVGLGRLDELGALPAIAQGAAAGRRERRLIAIADRWWRRYRLALEVPRWRLRLIWLLRNLEMAELEPAVARLRLGRGDAAAVRGAHGAGRALVERLRAGADAVELDDFMRDQPLEAALVAAAYSEAAGRSAAAALLADYLARSRHLALAIDGADLLAGGYAQSPAIGAALREIRRRKIRGELMTRADELAAAHDLLEEK